MRILLLGKNGQLGWELQRSLAPLGTVVALDYPEIDFSRPDDLRRLVEQTGPDAVLNAAAYTNVDKAQSEPELARAINATTPGVLAEAAAALQAACIHYSTDYVFDGRQNRPYVESDPTNPLNVYGQTKLEGEQAVAAAGGAWLVLRTSWVFSTRQGGFVTKVLQWSRQNSSLRMVTDQVGSPTWARMLAEATALLLAKAGPQPYAWLAERSGLYHLAGSGSASRFEWAQEILRLDPRPQEQQVKALVPALTAEFPSPAERPGYSVLDCSRFTDVFGLSLPPWQTALEWAMSSS